MTLPVGLSNRRVGLVMPTTLQSLTLVKVSQPLFSFIAGVFYFQVAHYALHTDKSFGSDFIYTFTAPKSLHSLRRCTRGFIPMACDCVSTNIQINSTKMKANLRSNQALRNSLLQKSVDLASIFIGHRSVVMHCATLFLL